MGKTVGNAYEEWDLSPLPVPVRSALYILEPMGVRTPWVECLTSYIARLAAAHCVYPGVLLEKMVIPLIPGYSQPSKSHYLFRRDGNNSNLFNFSSFGAFSLIKALHTLMPSSDLSRLVFTFVSNVVHTHALIRATKSWCPCCYEEWRVSKQIIYDPLIWMLQEMSVCTQHRVRLSTHCFYPDCQRLQPALTWRSRPGYCSYCQRWLGKASDEFRVSTPPIEEAEWMWQQWVTENVGEVLAIAPTTSPPERQRVAAVLVHAEEIVAEGNMTAFAQLLRQRRQHVWQLMKYDEIPGIHTLLQLCYALGISLFEFLVKPLKEIHFLPKQTLLWIPLPKEKKLDSIDRERFCQALKEALASDECPPPSLAEVARRLGVGSHMLYHCRWDTWDICQAISLRYKAYVQHRKEERMQGHRKEIKQVALQLQADEVSLTRKHIASGLTQPGILRAPEIREVLQEVCHELETDDGAELP
jgi:TniQ